MPPRARSPMNIRDTLARKFTKKINETLNLYIRKPRPQEVAIGPRWTRKWLIEGVDATTREIPAAYASFLPYHGAMVCIENQFQFFQFSLTCFLKVTRCCIHLRTSLLRWRQRINCTIIIIIARGVGVPRRKPHSSLASSQLSRIQVRTK